MLRSILEQKAAPVLPWIVDVGVADVSDGVRQQRDDEDVGLGADLMKPFRPEFTDKTRKAIIASL
jgi:hypothetical protein